MRTVLRVVGMLHVIVLSCSLMQSEFVDDEAFTSMADVGTGVMVIFEGHAM